MLDLLTHLGDVQRENALLRALVAAPASQDLQEQLRALDVVRALRGDYMEGSLWPGDPKSAVMFVEPGKAQCATMTLRNDVYGILTSIEAPQLHLSVTFWGDRIHVYERLRTFKILAPATQLQFEAYNPTEHVVPFLLGHVRGFLISVRDGHLQPAAGWRGS